MQAKDYHAIVDDCDRAESELMTLRAHLHAGKVQLGVGSVDQMVSLLSAIRKGMYHRIGILTSDLPK